jgi:hypothetical protein
VGGGVSIVPAVEIGDERRQLALEIRQPDLEINYAVVCETEVAEFSLRF